MPQFFIAAAILLVGLWGIRAAARMTPGQVRGFKPRLLGTAAMAAAAFLAMRGAMQLAVPLFLFGAGLWGYGKRPPNFTWSGKKSKGQSSNVSTSILSMSLDHDSGEMSGQILTGPFKGRDLATLDGSEIKAFHVYCAAQDAQSLKLLEAWLDRSRPSWRDELSTPPSHKGGAMTREEALSVLGLASSADESEIRAAHRRLMKDYHPDRGGSDYLAAKINQAKDVLLES